MILRSAGFVTSGLIRSQKRHQLCVHLYLWPREACRPPTSSVGRRWYVMSLLRGRYSGSPKQLRFRYPSDRVPCLATYTDAVIDAELPESFWKRCCRRRWIPPPPRAPISSSIGSAGEVGDLGFCRGTSPCVTFC